jgi:phosphonate transport system ATP-binding protein
LGYTSSWNSLVGRFSAEDQNKAWQAMERLGIENQAYKRADELSGGQQQRVGVARALMMEPKMILADEPVASLDPVLAHSILQYLEMLNQEDSMTIICSLHYLDLVQRYSTLVIGLREGEIVYQGSRSDIQAMTDEQFKNIYGEEAERVGGGLEGDLQFEEEGAS